MISWWWLIPAFAAGGACVWVATAFIQVEMEEIYDLDEDFLIDD